MVIKICPQSGGIIIIREGFTLNCGLGCLSYGKKFIRLHPQNTDILYRIMCAQGWVSASDVADWVYRARADGGSLQAEKILRNRVTSLRKTVEKKFRARLPVQLTRHGFEFFARVHRTRPAKKFHQREMTAA